jgi:hypothetical protein
MRMTETVTLESVLVASPDQISANVAPDQAGAVVILALKDGVYFEMNEVGGRIWNLLQHPQALKSVLARLLEEYEVNPAQCEADLLSLAQRLLERGLVELRNEAPP